MDDRKTRNDALQVLHERRMSPEVEAVMRWSGWVMEDAKDRLVTSEPERVAELQGRAKLMRELQQAIKNGPIKVPHRD